MCVRLNKLLSKFETRDGSKIPADMIGANRIENISFQPKISVDNNYDFNLWIKSPNGAPDRRTFKLKGLTLEKCLFLKKLIDTEISHKDDELFNMEVEVPEPVEEEPKAIEKNSKEIIPHPEQLWTENVKGNVWGEDIVPKTQNN